MMDERRRKTWWDWIVANHIESRLVVAVALVMLVWVTDWSFKFSASSKFDGVGTAAVIAAVQVPATWFIQAAFNTWKDLTK